MHVQGMDKIEQALKALPLKLAKNVMRGALAQAGNVYAKAARENIKRVTTKRSGRLLKSVSVSTRSWSDGRVTGSVKAKAYYAHMIERGTQAHTIRAKQGKAVSLKGEAAYKRVDVEGIKARPFMRPAFDQNSQRAITAALEYARDRISREGYESPDVNFSGAITSLGESE